jgi:hypothetical protein
MARGEEPAPAALRDAGLLARLGGHDGGEADARIYLWERNYPMPHSVRPEPIVVGVDRRDVA